VRIALIHALEESVAPARAAFAEGWPDALTFDLLDTSLAPDLADAGELTPSIVARFGELAGYAARTQGHGGRTAGILFTCSAFGPAIRAAAREVPIPVLDPVTPGIDAALDAAAAAGGRIGLVVSFAPSAPALAAELKSAAAARGCKLQLEVVVATGALASLKQGDGAAHDRQVVAAVATLPPVEVVLLGQFSLARAAPAVAAARESSQVLTTPGCAVAALRARLGG
jgi:hypothetical protein